MQGRVPKIVVVGNTYVDMVIRCSQFPARTQFVTGSQLSYTASGQGPNQAAAAALCDCQVYLVSKVGDDPFAQMVKTNLAEFNVNTDFVFTAKAKNTGVIVTLVNAKGENTGITYTGANSALSSQDINVAEQIISEADVCLIHGRLSQDAIVTAIRCAKVHGTKVILNPARPVCQPEQESIAIPIEYFSVNILISNLYEAADITDHSTVNIHTAKLIGSDLVARGVNSGVITMGKRGCLVVDRNNTEHISAFEVEVVDHTGRGDAFAGALAAYYATDNNIKEAAKFASAAGALACTKFGSLEAMPTKSEIIELLQKEDTE